MRMMPFLLPVLLVSVVASAQNTLTVPTPAFPTIQAAIVAAANGDTVNVQPGNYVENIDFLGKAIVVQSTQGALQTIISRFGAMATTVRFQFGETSTSVLDGFTIQNGNLGNISCEGASPRIRNCRIQAGLPTLLASPLVFRAGGITCTSGASPEIFNCVISGNGSPNSDAPGGVLLIGGAARLIGCTVSNNVSGGVGGIACNFGGSNLVVPTIEDCIVSGNQGGGIGFQAQGGAGGINLRIPATVRRTVITNNFGGNDFNGGGGGINIFGASPVVEDCIISGNIGGPGYRAVFIFPSQEGSGGGINIANGGSPIIRNCRIFGNFGGAGATGPLTLNPPAPPLPYITNGGAGGIELKGGCTPLITNCVVWANTGGAAGGAGTTGGAGGIQSSGLAAGPAPTPTVTNTVVWNNTGLAGGQQSIQLTGIGAAVVNNSAVQGGFPGTLNINLAPQFVSAATSDFHLAASSPCINRGSITAPGLPTRDLDGEPRVFYGIPDIGVDEFIDPCWRGVIGIGAGGPHAVVQVNGLTSVQQDAQVFTPLILEVLQPPTNPFAAAFVLGAHVGVVGPTSITNLGLIGILCYPFNSLNTVILASSFGLPILPLVLASEAPWFFSYPQGFPYPADVILQGIVEETPGSFKVTNGVLLHVF